MSFSSSAHRVAQSAPQTNIIPFPGSSSLIVQAEEKTSVPRYCDRQVLVRVIQFMEQRRIAVGGTREEVARKARLKPELIEAAEREFVIPNSRQFRAWSQALGMTWESVWSHSC